jgi:excisionase family DNA binding protein
MTDSQEVTRPRFMSPQEVAADLSIGIWQVYAMLRAGHLTALKMGRRTLIRTADVEAFIKSLPAAEYSSEPMRRTK